MFEPGAPKNALPGGLERCHVWGSPPTHVVPSPAVRWRASLLVGCVRSRCCDMTRIVRGRTVHHQRSTQA
ncbi:hypothetical protein J2X63_003188 [Agromyces sp. 3263]|nr:hypothetical protein [Agromyces sp. 3263]